MAEIIKIVGSRVRMYRQKAGLSQNELGELAGLHNTYIGQIERGEKNVSIEAIDKIIRAMGLSYEVFFANIGYSQAEDTAAECYNQIIKLDGRRQRLVCEIISNISKMIEL